MRGGHSNEGQPLPHDSVDVGSAAGVEAGAGCSTANTVNPAIAAANMKTFHFFMVFSLPERVAGYYLPYHNPFFPECKAQSVRGWKKFGVREYSNLQIESRGCIL